MLLHNAKNISEGILRDLGPYCDVINVAGSVRRGKAEVKDIEIVCIPKTSLHEERDLFGDVVSKVTMIDPGYEATVKALGTINKGKFLGRYMQVGLSTEVDNVPTIINIDIFTPQRHDYYRQFAIRTGSAEYAHKYIANQWVKRGWCGVNGDLRLQKECSRIGDSWFLRHDIKTPTLPPVWKSEEEFFAWLHIQYLEPEQRNL